MEQHVELRAYREKQRELTLFLYLQMLLIMGPELIVKDPEKHESFLEAQTELDLFLDLQRSLVEIDLFLQIPKQEVQMVYLKKNG